MGGEKGINRGFFGIISGIWTASVTVLLLASPLALERTLTPDAFFVGPLTYDPFDAISLDAETQEILMLSSAVKGAEGEARVYFQRLELPKENEDTKLALLSSTDHDAENAQLRVAPNGRLHAIWLEVVPRRTNQLVHRFSDDGGENWSKATRFAAGFSRRMPLLRVLSERHVLVGIETALERGTSQNVLMWVSADGGESWQESNPNFSETRGDVTGLKAVSDGPERILVTWIQHARGGDRVMVNVSSDGGISWLKQPISLSDDPQRRIVVVEPFLLSEGYAVAWMDGGRFNYRFVFDRSDAGGRSWGRDAVFCELKVRSVTPQIILAKERLFLVTKEVEGDGRARFEKLVVRSYRHQGLTELGSAFVIDDAGKLGETILDFFATASRDDLYLSSIAHSYSGGWRNRLWRFDAERQDIELLWENSAGTQTEVTSTALAELAQQLWMVTLERKPRRFPQQTPFEGRLVLRKFDFRAASDSDSMY